MKPEEFAWNKRERQLYIENRIMLPTPYKIKIRDDENKRNQLEGILNRLPQREPAVWARRNADRFIAYIDIGNQKIKEDIVFKTDDICKRESTVK